MGAPICMILSESDTSESQLLAAENWEKSIAARHRKSFIEIHFKSCICCKQKTSLIAANTLRLYHQWANTRPAATALDMPFRETGRRRGKPWPVYRGRGWARERARSLSYRNLNRLYQWVRSGSWGGLGKKTCVAFFFSAPRFVWVRNLICSISSIIRDIYVRRYAVLSLCKDIFNVPRWLTLW